MRSPCSLALTSALLLLTGLTGCQEPNEVESAEPATSGQGATGAAVETATLCNIEMVDGVLFNSEPPVATSSARIRGWLGSDAGKALDSPLLVMADTDKTVVRTFPLQLSIDRPDVVQAFPGSFGLEKSGFEVSVSPAADSGGEYHLYLTYRSGLRSFICDNGRRIRFAK